MAMVSTSAAPLLSLKLCVNNASATFPASICNASFGEKLEDSSFLRTHLVTLGVQFWSRSVKRKSIFILSIPCEIKETLLCSWGISTRTAFRRVNYRQ